MAGNRNAGGALSGVIGTSNIHVPLLPPTTVATSIVYQLSIPLIATSTDNRRRLDLRDVLLADLDPWMPEGYARVGDPSFVSPFDRHLTALSPAIDAAADTGEEPRDLDGLPRFDDRSVPNDEGIVDLGAYEAQFRSNELLRDGFEEPVQ